MSRPVLQPGFSEGRGGVDFLVMEGNNFRAHGTAGVAAQLLKYGFNVQALRPNGVLQKDEWKILDDTVTQVARARLRGIADLISRGLTVNLRNPLGTTRME